jgi:hypothetical protein
MQIKPRLAVVVWLMVGALGWAGFDTRLARAAGVDPSRATAVQREQAQARFAKGKKLLSQHKREQALTEFRASHEIVASPNTRLLVARCLLEMGRLVEAYAELGRTLAEAQELQKEDSRYSKTAESALDERHALAPKLGFASVTLHNAGLDTKLMVAEEEIRRAAWSEPVPLAPGTTEMRIETPGRPVVRKSITVAAGETIALTLDAGAPRLAAAPKPVSTPAFVAPASPSTGLRPFAYVAGGIGVLGLATFGIAGGMARSKYNQLDRECGGPCPDAREDEIASGRTQQTIANVGLVVGLVGIASGVTLFVLSRPGAAASAPNTAVVATPNWVGVRGAL